VSRIHATLAITGGLKDPHQRDEGFFENLGTHTISPRSSFVDFEKSALEFSDFPENQKRWFPSGASEFSIIGGRWWNLSR
jgi:hypothetical protein